MAQVLPANAIASNQSLQGNQSIQRNQLVPSDNQSAEANQLFPSNYFHSFNQSTKSVKDRINFYERK